MTGILRLHPPAECTAPPMTDAACLRCGEPAIGASLPRAWTRAAQGAALAFGAAAALIGARDFASQIYDLALLRALIGVGRDLVEGALDTSEEVAPLAQIERAETELYKVAEEGGAEGKAKSFAEATKDARAAAGLEHAHRVEGLRTTSTLGALRAAGQAVAAWPWPDRVTRSSRSTWPRVSRACCARRTC